MDELGETYDGPETLNNVKLIYFINDDYRKEAYLILINYNGNDNIILYEEIVDSFYIFLQQMKNNSGSDSEYNEMINREFFNLEQNCFEIVYIRYFDGEGWISLEKDDIIYLEGNLTLGKLKIMINANILTDEKIELQKKYNEIESDIKHIKDIYDALSLKKKEDNPPDAPMNFIVLTANPLMDDDKELRTMNDFNIITSKIYKILNDKNYLNYSEFIPLTKKTLKDILTDEKRIPVVFHLICKSTYIIQKQKNNNSFVNLIFEKDELDKNKINYNLEFIDKNILENEIFNFELNPKMKENVGGMTLIISTPLAEDVYDLFKDFGFKNLIVQHTTLANVDFVANYNREFYELMLRSDKTINQIFEYAFAIYIDNNNPPVFCCCFHKHKIDCKFALNLKNELYNDNTVRNLENLDEFLPHFHHLIPDSECQNYCLNDTQKYLKKINQEEKYPENLFCCHTKNCCDYYNYLNKHEIYKKGKNSSHNLYSLCCCNENIKKHKKSSTFIKYFANENNNTLKFRGTENIIGSPFIPNFEKMSLLVGKNKIVFETLNFFYSKEQCLYIYNDEMINLKILGNIIIEYYKEKNYDLYEQNNEEEEEKEVEINDDNRIKKIKSSPLIKNNKIVINDNVILASNKIFSGIISDTIRKKFIFEENDLIDDNSKILKADYNLDEQSNNTIFFIYVYNINLVNKIKIKNNKIIVFSEEKIHDGLELIPEPKIEFDEKKDKIYKNKDEIIPNEYIKFQHNKVLRNNWRKKPK